MKTLYTIGHSTKPLEEFLAELTAHRIELLVDVRSIPGSRRHPQYGRSALAHALKEADIEYRWLEALGGRRHGKKDSANTGWRNASFRGYADYMQTGEFATTLAELESLAQEKTTAIMCAEAVPWRCHRSLVADALVARGWRVLNIFNAHTTKAHGLNPMAKIIDEQLTYPS